MTTGERIAKDFSENKCHLTNAEQRRLATMIDHEFSRNQGARNDVCVASRELQRELQAVME